ncbi:hypothetical protein [Robbsia sp. KACC 23696]|uniref:hypothetical protein n=1 Tax=Robbsia sp. KACC 23696 TaxID=3149231 RepID=UPI00325A6DF3
MSYLLHPSPRIRTGVVLTVLVALPLGIAFAPSAAWANRLTSRVVDADHSHGSGIASSSTKAASASGTMHGRPAQRGIVHAPQHDASQRMVREAPRSPTESGMVHDPSARGHDALSGKPATNGVLPHRRSERIAPATD